MHACVEAEGPLFKKGWVRTHLTSGGACKEGRRLIQRGNQRTRPPSDRDNTTLPKLSFLWKLIFLNQQGEVEQILEEATPLITVEAKKPN